ncbi:MULTISPECIES: peptidase M23 [Snodgrassella]|uniref:peptidase M23 n=1 Tax=Snodgrassella TaxID=1193515 RepID=UPI000998255E|nr:MULTISPECIES: peptidase M23 [Snodgrassella]MBI0097926.1 peptidase M23 [Snodgrassella sp. W8134]MBI0101716.1 peptidase M23 [Snodgrassella sp. W8135]MBI0130281.1 peptidase M23 [Snodgrassella sp. W8124]MBI0133736.1 peptidase M23 [Snodgrassella sp. W8132]MBI0181079.1 peptidase M23 [Snodgrassella sp. W8158]
MESTLQLHHDLYPKVMPAGAFYAVSSPNQSASRMLLANILQADINAKLTEERLKRWAETDDVHTALNLLYRLQRLEFLYGEAKPSSQLVKVTSDEFENILGQLSDSHKALLVDQDGFYFANVGFNHETAEEVANLASEATRLTEKHSLLIKNNLNIYNNAIGICDPAGQSELTFFPLYIGNTKNILVTAGLPLLNGEAFVTMVRGLYVLAGEDIHVVNE